VVIEPWLTDQWYVDAATLAKPAIEAVRKAHQDRARRRGKKTWFNWLENIQPWCVSRQLWWGHRIPAWYDDEDGNVFVAETEERRRQQAGDGQAELARTRTCSTPGSPRRCGRSRRSAGPTRRGSEAPLSQRRADLRLRHHLLLGCPDGDAGLQFMGEVPWKTLYLPRPGPRRAGPEDVQVEGQYGRSARA
jgi:valyl-tRNA synthetase